MENDSNNEQQDTREATMWLGTDDGVFVHSIGYGVLSHLFVFF